MTAELHERIDAFRRAIARRTLAGVVARAVAALGAGLLWLAAIDVWRPMSAPLLVLAGGAWVCAAVIALVMALIVMRRARLSRHAAARLIEERAGDDSSRIINALMLDQESNPGRAGAWLAQRAIDRGVERLQLCDARALLRPETRAAWRGLALLAAAGIIAGTVWGLWPRALSTTLMRLAQPMADHPPYSATVYDLEINPPRPMLADDVEVVVRMRGAPDGGVQLLIRDDAGAERRIPMIGAERSRTWIARLRSVDRPLRVRAFGDTGRSAWAAIVPDDSFRILAQEATIEPPSYSGLATRTISLRDDPITIDAVAGSLIHLRTRTSGPARADGLMVEPMDATHIEVSTTGVTHAARLGPIEHESFRVRARISSARDGSFADGAELRINPRADAPPTLTLRTPSSIGGSLIAPARSMLSFEAEAADDLGLSVLGMSCAVFDARGVWRSTTEIMRLSRNDAAIVCGPERPIEFDASIDVESVGGEPGGRLSVVILAADSRDAAHGGAQRAQIGPVIINLSGESLSSDDLGAEEDWISAGATTRGDASRASAARAAGSASAEPGPSVSDGGIERRGGGTARATGSEGSDALADDSHAEPDESTDEPMLARAGGSWDAAWRPLQSAPILGGGAPRVPEAYRDVAARYFRLLREREPRP